MHIATNDDVDVDNIQKCYPLQMVVHTHTHKTKIQMTTLGDEWQKCFEIVVPANDI